MKIRLDVVRGSDPPLWRTTCVNVHGDLDIGFVRQIGHGLWSFHLEPLDAEVDAAAMAETAGGPKFTLYARDMPSLVEQLEQRLTLISARGGNDSDAPGAASRDSIMANLTSSVIFDIAHVAFQTEGLAGVIGGIAEALAMICDRYIRDDLKATFVADFGQHVEQCRQEKSAVIDEIEAHMRKVVAEIARRREGKT